MAADPDLTCDDSSLTPLEAYLEIPDELPDVKASIMKYWPYPIISLHPWWLFILGVSPHLKRTENRHEKAALVGKTFSHEGVPVALYMTKCPAESTCKHQFKLPEIQKALQHTKWAGLSLGQLYNECKSREKQIVAVAWFTVNPTPGENYIFRDFPTPSTHHFYVTQIKWLKAPVAIIGFTMNQGWNYFKNAQTLRNFIANIPVKFHF